MVYAVITRSSAVERLLWSGRPQFLEVFLVWPYPVAPLAPVASCGTIRERERESEGQRERKSVEDGWTIVKGDWESDLVMTDSCLGGGG